MGVPRRIESRYGLRGIRVGEASHPGPPRLSPRRAVRHHSQDSVEHLPPSEELLDALQEDLLARPNQRRTRRRVVHSDDDVFAGDLPEASRRLVLVGGSENSHSLPDLTVPDHRVGLPSVPDTVPASSAGVRRLVLVQSHVSSEAVGTVVLDDVDFGEPPARASDHAPSFAGESDTESVAGISEPDLEGEVVEPTAVVEPMVFDSRPSQFHAAFASLDVVDLKEVFSNRAAVMRSVPSFLRGAFRTTMRVALTEIVKGIDEQSNVRMSRGWKLFLLLPRLLLHKPVRGGLVPKKTLEARFHMFQMGQWHELLDASISNTAKIHQRSVRRRRREQGDGIEKRANRALSLVQMGELSAARQALDGAPIAPGTLATLRALTDPEKRPPSARQELSDEAIRIEWFGVLDVPPHCKTGSCRGAFRHESRSSLPHSGERDQFRTVDQSCIHFGNRVRAR